MKTATKQTARSTGVWQGMNWIRQEKRLAVYLRDGLACAWCGKSVEEGVALSLDHLKPHSKGGSNHESNLVTCCKFCNDSRGARTQVKFAAVVAAYINHGATADAILKQVRACSARSIKVFIPQARDMIARRGSVAKCLSKGE